MIHEGTLYESSVPFSLERFVTPVTALIEGIWLAHPEKARALLRERIYTDLALTPADEGSVKVAAKRITQESPLHFQSHYLAASAEIPKRMVRASVDSNFSDPKQLRRTLSIDTVANLLDELNSQIHVRKRSYHSARLISAVLVNPEYQILAYAWNQTETFKHQHAEQQLVRSWVIREQAFIPPHSKLYVSLRPCAMCAGILYSTCESPETLETYFLTDDPGPKAKNSVFQPGSDLWRKAGRPAVQCSSFTRID